MRQQCFGSHLIIDLDGEWMKQGRQIIVKGACWTNRVDSDNISPESLDLASQLVNFNIRSLLYSSCTILKTIRAILLENLECIEI